MPQSDGDGHGRRGESDLFKGEIQSDKAGVGVVGDKEAVIRGDRQGIRMNPGVHRSFVAAAPREEEQSGDDPHDDHTGDEDQ